MPRARCMVLAACLLPVLAHSGNTSAEVVPGLELASRAGSSTPSVPPANHSEHHTLERQGEEKHRIAEEQAQEHQTEDRQGAERQVEEEAQGEELHVKEPHPQDAEERGAERSESFSDDSQGHGEHEEPQGEGHGEERLEGFSEGEEGVEEHEATPVDVAISCCLCGGVSLVMLLFYLVNHHDKDIRFYAWSIISSTISIFLSVLLYQGINTFITHYVISFTSTGAWGLIGVAYSLMVGWMICLEIVMMFIADIFKLPECLTGNRYLMIQLWGRLCAHITGFASIRAGCSLHHIPGIAADPLSALGVVVAHSLVLGGLSLLFEGVRTFVATRRGITHNRWLEEIVEAENDVSALSLSFLTVQVLRFAISGVLPNHEGLEEPQLEHSVLCSVQLFAAAGGFAGLVVVMVMLIAQSCTRQSVVRRVLSVLQVTSAMACAWSIFFASKWELRRFLTTWDPNAMSARVVLALAVSGSAFGLIFVLDQLEDLDFTGRDVDRAIVSLISAMGILVGFSWEQSFEGAVGVFSAFSPMPYLAELCTACLTAVIVIPAWRNYIITSLVKSEACYLHNFAKKRTRELSDEAKALVLESQDLERVPGVDRASSRSMMLITGGGDEGESSPKR